MIIETEGAFGFPMHRAYWAHRWICSLSPSWVPLDDRLFRWGTRWLPNALRKSARSTHRVEQHVFNMTFDLNWHSFP